MTLQGCNSGIPRERTVLDEDDPSSHFAVGQAQEGGEGNETGSTKSSAAPDDRSAAER